MHNFLKKMKEDDHLLTRELYQIDMQMYKIIKRTSVSKYLASRRLITIKGC